MNITNTFIDLSPVINQMADTMGKQVLYFDDTGDWENKRTCSTWWALITSNQEFLHNPEVLKHTSKRPNVKPLPWSDDFSNLFDVIKK